MRFWKPKKVAGQPLVSLVVAAYVARDLRQQAALLSFLHSLRAQTYHRWEAIVIHDGPCPAAREAVAALQDVRIRFRETEARLEQFGHPHRSWGIRHARGEYIGLSNGDNWYCPVYFSEMLHTLKSQRAQFVYCNMIHSHQGWKPFTTQPRGRQLDLGAWIADAAIVKATPWTDFSFSGDATFINAVMRQVKKTAKVHGHLFVHN